MCSLCCVHSRHHRPWLEPRRPRNDGIRALVRLRRRPHGQRSRSSPCWWGALRQLEGLALCTLRCSRWVPFRGRPHHLQVPLRPAPPPRLPFAPAAAAQELAQRQQRPHHPQLTASRNLSGLSLVMVHRLSLGGTRFTRRNRFFQFLGAPCGKHLQVQHLSSTVLLNVRVYLLQPQPVFSPGPDLQ